MVFGSKITNQLEFLFHFNSLALTTKRFPLIDLFTLLSSTTRGKKILSFYNENSRLDNINRDEVIAILVEEIFYGNTSLKPNDFYSLVTEICSVFPSGKLFYKYVNCRKSKKGSQNNIPHNVENNTHQCTEELDTSIISALKLSLSKENADWNEVLDKWAKTFAARQQDVKSLASVDFLKAWPKLADARAPELIEIDFDFLCPLKQGSLRSKWDHFKRNIVRFYEININNDNCKQLFSLAKSLTNTDSQDYLLSILLTSVLQTSSRFTNNSGKRSKKITIIDAQESFVLHIESINDYQLKIYEIVRKYYSCHLTIQPFLIVVGSVNDLKSFFIYFDSTLYKFSTFLESLDFPESTILIRHFKFDHLLKTKFLKIKCAQHNCDQTFTNFTSFQRHLNNQHNVSNNGISNSISTTYSSTNYSESINGKNNTFIPTTINYKSADYTI
ncbi:uncharacterized protein [Eurosta solidaginis]|uniref:uncharacterized protein n=1 Tax=Eurosta solidaginis TaxID=178769 RepID=UPI003531367C